MPVDKNNSNIKDVLQRYLDCQTTELLNTAITTELKQDH